MGSSRLSDGTERYLSIGGGHVVGVRLSMFAADIDQTPLEAH